MPVKITATITVLIAFVLGLAVLMNYAKFERTFNGLMQSRLAFLVQDLRDTLEFGLDLGLDPAAMANTAAILTREAAHDPHILSISVFNEQGHILYQYQSKLLDPHPVTPLTPAWLETVLQTASKTPQHISDPETLMVGIPLINNFGRTVGGLILRYDRSFHDQELQQTLFNLIRAALLILIAASLVALLSVWLLFRSTRRELRQVRIALEDFLENQQRPASPHAGDSVLAALEVAAEQKSREFQQRLILANRILRLEQRLAGQAPHGSERQHEGV
ncbi:MAG TPA: hypothetical protein DEP36_10385 [Gammaproteobacteria bacterium]|nr:hypothetical protein [Gammaproteobacteria bacterium]HRF44666.1 hypothetical protein [Candidatus Competibacteraceae bacterium]